MNVNDGIYAFASYDDDDDDNDTKEHQFMDQEPLVPCTEQTKGEPLSQGSCNLN